MYEVGLNIHVHCNFVSDGMINVSKHLLIPSGNVVKEGIDSLAVDKEKADSNESTRVQGQQDDAPESSLKSDAKPKSKFDKSGEIYYVGCACYTPRKRSLGVYRNHSVCLSVCPSVCLSRVNLTLTIAF